jgi:hypothetical protein
MDSKYCKDCKVITGESVTTKIGWWYKKFVLEDGVEEVLDKETQ